MIEPQEIERLRRHLKAITKMANDPEAFAAVEALVGEFRTILVAQARQLHAEGYSWADLARPLGLTKQAIHIRYAEVPLPEVPPEDLYQYPGRAAQHTFTLACDGHHEAGPCPEPASMPLVSLGFERSPEPEISAPWRSSAEAEWDESR